MLEKLSRRSLIRAGLAGGAAIAASAAGAAALAAKGAYKAGTYTAKAAGIGGDVTVTMTFDANAITDVVIDASSETPSIG